MHVDTFELKKPESATAVPYLFALYSRRSLLLFDHFLSQFIQSFPKAGCHCRLLVFALSNVRFRTYVKLRDEVGKGNAFAATANPGTAGPK